MSGSCFSSTVRRTPSLFALALCSRVWGAWGATGDHTQVAGGAGCSQEGPPSPPAQDTAGEAGRSRCLGVDGARAPSTGADVAPHCAPRICRRRHLSCARSQRGKLSFETARGQQCGRKHTELGKLPESKGEFLFVCFKLRLCLSGAAAGHWGLGSRGHPRGHQGSLRGHRTILCGRRHTRSVAPVRALGVLLYLLFTE